MKQQIKFQSLENLNFCLGTYKQVIKYIINQLINQKQTLLLPCSLNDLASIHQQPSLKKLYQQLNIITTDGMPLVWYFNYKLKQFNKKSIKVERVYGPTLMKDILALTTNPYFKHCFYGSSPATINKLKQVISPKLTKTIFISPPYRKLTKQEEQQYIDKLKKENINMLWIGISSPKQVQLAINWKQQLPNTNFFCIGAGFDFITNTKPTAPKIIQQLGLEWLYRLLHEPKRLIKRYLVTIPKYLITKITHSF